MLVRRRPLVDAGAGGAVGRAALITGPLWVEPWLSDLMGEGGRCKLDGCIGGADRFAANLGAVEITDAGRLEAKLLTAGMSGEPFAYINLLARLSCNPPPTGV
jgi:hypothetical protein